MTPYQHAADRIVATQGDPRSRSLAMLLLSLSDANMCFGLAECTEGLDEHWTALVIRVIGYWAQVGHNHELEAARRIAVSCWPELATIAAHGAAAKRQRESEIPSGDMAGSSA